MSVQAMLIAHCSLSYDHMIIGQYEHVLKVLYQILSKGVIGTSSVKGVV